MLAAGAATMLCLLAAVPVAAASETVPLTGAANHLLITVRGSSLEVTSSDGGAHLRLPSGTRITAAAGLRDGWIVAGTTRSSTERRLYIALSSSGQVSVLPQPALSGDHLVAAPALFVGTARNFQGIAWLEGSGPRSLAVRAASWDGSRWGPTQMVSPRGPGSQLALSAAVLSDGSQLLVWSRFDGRFDQIAWSRKRADQWSAPRNLTSDSVPDITPALNPFGNGAVVAWSHYDGHDYRIALARFDDDQWTRLGTLPQRGAISPTFTPSTQGGDVALLFPSVAPKEWSIQILDSRARLVRQGSVPLVTYSRPVLQETNGKWSLRWPDHSTRVELGPIGAISPLSPPQR